MKIIDSLITGFKRSLRAWKGVLISTSALLLVTSFFAKSLKTIIQNGFGSSLAPDELAHNFNFDLIIDLTRNIGGTGSIIPSDLFLVFFTGFVLTSFFSGGFFSYVKGEQFRFSIPNFFSASAEYFWHFFALSFIISMMIAFISFFLFAIFAGFGYFADPSGGQIIISIIAILVLIIVMILFLLIADYSRACCVAQNKPGIFRAIGFGLKMTFGTFSTSVPMMLFLLIINILLLWLMAELINKIRPDSGFTVFLLFLLSQVLFFIRMWLRTWRYASITSLMERRARNHATLDL